MGVICKKAANLASTQKLCVDLAIGDGTYCVCHNYDSASVGMTRGTFERSTKKLTAHGCAIAESYA